MIHRRAGHGLGLLTLTRGAILLALVVTCLGAVFGPWGATPSSIANAGPRQVTPEPTATSLPESYRLAAVWDKTVPAPGLFDPAGVDIGRDGLVAIAERGNHRVSYWGFAGDLVRTLGSRGSDDGQLLAPEDVAVDVDRDRLYVADTGNHRVQVYRRSGSAAGTWPGMGTPRGIAADLDSGRVYVADATGHRLLVLDENGVLEATWGGFGRAAGQLDTPLGLAVGVDGLIYVADSGNRRVQWLDADGQPVGQLALDNRADAGGIPTDVGLDDNGDLYVTVERAVLRFRGRATPARPQPAYEQVKVVDPARGCLPSRPCYLPGEIAANHEGVQRLAYHPTIGLAVTYAPTVRFGDWAWVVPERDFTHFIPKVIAEPSSRHAHAPQRVDATDEPLYAQVLDTTGQLRVFRRDGAWYDPFHLWPAGPGQDLATAAGATGVITTNTVTVVDPTAFTGNLAWDSHALDPDQRTRRGRTGDLIPDYGWWNRALALSPTALACPPEGDSFQPVAVLNAGYGRLVLRLGPDGVYEEVGGRRAGRCQQLLASFGLPKAGQTFRAFSDVDYDARGQLTVLARDGGVIRYDDKGRSQGETQLAGLAHDAAEAIAVELAGVTFVLTGSGRILKHDDDGNLLAAWSVSELAGPGDFTDVTVGDDDRVIVTDAANDRLVVFEPDPEPVVEPPPGDSPCRLTPDKVANPTQLLLGDTTQVTLSLAGACAEPVDVALVVDGSCQMGGERLAKAREAAALLVDALRPDDRIAIVNFSDESGSARLRAGLAEDRATARAAATELGVDCLPPLLFPGRLADGRIADGLRAGREALSGPGSRATARKALILLSPSIFDRKTLRDRMDGQATPKITDREHALWEARRLWSAGVEVWTVGPGQDFRDRDPGDANDIQLPHPPDEGLLAALALPWDHYRYAETGGLPAVFAEIGAALAPSAGLQALEIVDRIPANMRLVPGSVQPPAAVLPDGSLRWAFADTDPAALPALTYDLEPLDPGHWPTNIEASADYIDAAGRSGHVLYPVPEVDVLAPTPTATATDEPTPTLVPSATSTATATATETPTATATPTASPRPSATRVPAAMYLPILLKQQCVPQVLAVDVALVLDTSSSMAGAKLDSAVAAARIFLSLLTFPRDHATLVAFNSDALVVRPLSGVRTEIESGLTSLPSGVGTRIDLGLSEAISELKGERSRTEAAAVIVLLTDGRPDGGTIGTVSGYAELARRLHITVFAIGLGEDVLPDVLQIVAGDPRRVYLAPGPADLEAIYREIARVIPCR